MSIFTWFRPYHSVFLEHVKRRPEFCSTVELFYRCLLKREIIFFATSSI